MWKKKCNKTVICSYINNKFASTIPLVGLVPQAERSRGACFRIENHFLIKHNGGGPHPEMQIGLLVVHYSAMDPGVAGLSVPFNGCSDPAGVEVWVQGS